MKRGRKLGVKVGPTVGSRTWALLRMKPGERLFYQSKTGTALMQQISADITRAKLNGERTLRQAFAVVPAPRELIELVIVEYPEERK